MFHQASITFILLECFNHWVVFDLAEQQSKLAAMALSGEWHRPVNVDQLCREIEQPHMKQIKTSRHTITVDFHKFIREIKAEIRKQTN